ncbi:NB-ARC domain-containing protein [Streptomyces sp. NPDC001889]
MSTAQAAGTPDGPPVPPPARPLAPGCRGPAAPSYPKGADGVPFGTRTGNLMDGVTVHGNAVQAGYIAGDVHLHPAAPARPPVPHQIPPVPGSFTGRAEDLRELTAWTRRPGPAVRTVVLHGAPGAGKTALAARLLGHLHAEFPGGRLHADLQGPGGQPAGTGEILGRLLRSLRTGPLPSSTRERAGWWRSVTAERAVAVLLDHAHDEGQVRALLPGGRGHLVVVTSRKMLADLVRDGTRLHHVGPLTPSDAHVCLTRMVGPDRIGGEPGAARTIVDLSAGLPLALGLAAAALVARPDRTVAETADALVHTAPGPADDRFGTAVTTALDHAHQALPGPTARVYRLLGTLFTADADPALTAAACSLTEDEARRHLAVLAAAGLLQEAGDDPARGTVYVFHNASRAHALQHARADGAESERQEPVRRALDWMLCTMTAAERLLTPTHRRLSRTYAYPPGAPAPFTTEEGAAAWLTAYRDSFLPAVRTAHALGLHATCWQITHALWPFLRTAHDYGIWFETHELGLAAARACDDEQAGRELLNAFGIGLRGDGRHTAAIERFREVLHLARADGDERGEAQALHDIGATQLAADEPVAAKGPLEQAKELRAALAQAAEEAGDEPELLAHRRSAALTDTALGQVALDEDDGRTAIERLSCARTVLAGIGDRVDAGRALAWLGRAYALTGDDHAAVDAGRQAAREFTELGVPRWRARSLELLGLTHRDAARPAEAHALLDQALTLYTQLSVRDARRVAALLEHL